MNSFSELLDKKYYFTSDDPAWQKCGATRLVYDMPDYNMAPSCALSLAKKHNASEEYIEAVREELKR